MEVALPVPLMASDGGDQRWRFRLHPLPEELGWFRRFCRFVSQRFRRATRTLTSRRSSWFAVLRNAHGSRVQGSPLIDQCPSHSNQLGSLGIGHGGPQRNDFGWIWIAMGPTLDPSIGRICVFRAVFWSSSSPISSAFSILPTPANRRSKPQELNQTMSRLRFR